jgi:serine/threonine protein kinase
VAVADPIICCCTSDLKPENVLLKNVGADSDPVWEARVADLDGGTDLSKHESDAAGNGSDGGKPAGSAGKPWQGTYEYMSPECSGQNREKYGQVGSAADVFSFAVMLWEMLMGKRVRLGFPDNQLDFTNKNGRRVEDLQSVAVWLLAGQRPEVHAGFPTPLRLLLEACWQDMPTDRMTFQIIVPVLKGLRDETSSNVIMDAEDTDTRTAPEYDRFLATLGMQDQKQALTPYLSSGRELTELKQMDEEDLKADIVDDDDLGWDSDTKDRFVSAVAELRLGSNPEKNPQAAYEALIDWTEANLDEKTAVEIRKEQLVAGVHRADGKAYDVVEKWKATHHTPVMQKMTQKMQKEMQNMQRASGSTGSGA